MFHARKCVHIPVQICKTYRSQKAYSDCVLDPKITLVGKQTNLQLHSVEKLFC